MTASFFVSLGLVWILVYLFYVDYRIDYFRERLFELRAELFDIARTGGLSFDHQAYGLLRTMLNGFLRHANRLNVVSTLALLAGAGPVLTRTDTSPEAVDREWFDAIGTLPIDVRDKLSDVRTRMHLEVAQQALLASPMWLLTLVPIFVVCALHFAGTKAIGDGVMKVYGYCGSFCRRAFIGPLDAAALEFGRIR